MKQILGLFLILIISVLLMTVAAIPAMLWLDNWLKILGAFVCFIAIIGIEVLLLARYLTAILDALIKKGNEQSKQGK